MVSGQTNSYTLILTVVPPGNGIVTPTGTITLYDTFEGATTVLVTIPFGGSGTFPSFTQV